MGYAIHSRRNRITLVCYNNADVSKAQWFKWKCVDSTGGAEGAENETLWASKGEGKWNEEEIPLHVRLEGLGSVVSSPAGSGAESRPKTNLMHFVFHRTHLVKGKFNLFIDNFSGTNKRTIVRISWRPQIKLHNEWHKLTSLVNAFVTINSDDRVHLVQGRLLQCCTCLVCRIVISIDFSPLLMPLLVLRLLCRYDHFMPLLNALHWLRVLERITYKLCVLVYNCLHGTAPRYLQDVFKTACCWSNVAPSTAVCFVIRSCGASNTSFIAWRPSLCSCWTTRVEQFTWVTSPTGLHLSPSRNISILM